MDCIFCQIIDNDIPSYKVYEDENVVAFLDILPISPGHVIIAPKEHVANLEDLSDEMLCAMTKTFKKIGKAMTDGLDAKGYSVLLNNKSAAQQHVPHVHFHVVPRAEGDGLERWPQSGYDEGQAEFYQQKIKSKL